MRKAFEEIVEEALKDLPAPFRDRLENVVVQVASRPTGGQMKEVGLRPGDDLLGLYEGTPLTERGPDWSGPPDTIWIFQEPIEACCANRNQIVTEIQDTVVHEIGHFFGLDEDEIGEIEDGYEY